MISPIFTYDDTVVVLPSVGVPTLVGRKASIVGIFEEPRTGSFFEKFPPGVVYSVEFEDGSSMEIHESNLVSSS